MTDSLRDALRKAADDGRPYGSGVTGRDLLRRGRRKARRRRISGTTVGGLALVAAIGIPLAPGLLPEWDNASDSDRTRTTTDFDRTPHTRIDGFCAAPDFLEDWTEVVAVRDRYFATAVFVSPDGDRWAGCLGDDAAGEGYGAMPKRGDHDVGYRPHVHWLSDDCATGIDDRVCAWGTVGRVRPNVARMTFESADGRSSDAEIRDGFFAWQSEVDGIEVFNRPLWVTLYDASGDQLDRLNANRNPDTW